MGSDLQRVQRHNRALLHLARSRAVHAGDLPEAFREITEASAEALDVSRVGVWLFDETGTRLRCVHLLDVTDRDGDEGSEIRQADFPSYFEALRAERQVAAPDIASDPRTRELAQPYAAPLGIRSLLDGAVRVRGRLAGVVCHETVGEARSWTPTEEQFAASVADFAARALEARERRETREKYRDLFELSHDAVVLLDGGDGSILEANERFRRLFGYDEADLRGLSFRDLHTESSLALGERCFAEVRETGSVRFLADFVTAAGEVFPADVAAHRLEVGDRKVVQAAMRDMSERAAADRALRASEARYRSLFEQNVAGVARGTFDGQVLECNQAFAEIFGFEDPDEITGDPSVRLLPLPAEREAFLGELAERGEIRNRVLEARRRDGEPVWILVNSTVVDEEEEQRIVTTVVDVTERRRAEEALRESESHLRMVADQMPAVLWTTDGDLRFVSSMGAGLAALGLTRNEVRGSTLQEFFHTDDPEFLPIAMHRQALQGRAVSYSVEWGERVFRSHLEPLRDGGGEVEGVIGVAFDITELEEKEEELRASEQRFRSLFEESMDAILLTDRNGTIVLANEAAARLSGWDRDELHGRPARRLFVEPAQWKALLRDVVEEGGVGDFEAEVQARDGARLQVLVSATPRRSPDGELLGFQALVRDITERKRFERELERRALHDQLTGLPNRALFWDRVDHALQRTGREGSRLAVCFIDLDRFKVVNDSLGHSAGDRLLEEVAQRVAASFREEDTVARFGGDEFTVLLEDLEDAESAIVAARRFARALREPFHIRDQELHLTASIGIAMGTGPGERPDDLLRRADVAMYRAKEKGGTGHHVFDPRRDQAATRRLQSENELRRAVEGGQFLLHYQPVVSLATGSVVAVEALARWAHPERGLVPPSGFIELAEETGLIVPLGGALLQRACREVGRWRSDEGEPLHVQVNLSARQCEDPELSRRVREALDASGLDAGRLQLEMTERVVMHSTDRVNELKALGVEVAVDDFGTGYSSLRYVKELDVDVLKIDRTFVDGLGRDRRDEAIVRTILTLGKTLGLRVVAEGIERREQADHLRGAGCEWGQGYLFGRPAPPAELERRLGSATGGG